MMPSSTREPKQKRRNLDDDIYDKVSNFIASPYFIWNSDDKKSSLWKVHIFYSRDKTYFITFFLVFKTMHFQDDVAPPKPKRAATELTGGSYIDLSDSDWALPPGGLFSEIV